MTELVQDPTSWPNLISAGMPDSEIARFVHRVSPVNPLLV